MSGWTVERKVALVTGSTSGVGEALALGLAAAGAHVIVHGRDAARADAVVARIQASGGQAEAVLGDMGRPDEVRRVAQTVLAAHPRLHLLVHSAGLFTYGLERTPDGREAMFAINHLGPFLLTRLLQARLIESAPARVVMVASDAHRYSKLNLDDLDWHKGWASFKAYGASKGANILFASELSRRLAQDGVQTASFHPGYVATRITRAGAGWMQTIADGVASIFARTPAQGAETGVWLCTAQEIVSGGYYQDRKLRKPAAHAVDPVRAARLWELSEGLVGV